MRKMQSYSYDEAHTGYGDSNQMELDVIGNRHDGAVTKFFQPAQDQVFGDSGISSWRFTWPHYSLGSDLHSTDFTGMNASGVISTWGGGSPRENLAAFMSNNRHAVSGLDFIDTIPADGVFLDRIGDDDAFIENRDFWSENYEIDNAGHKGRPDGSHNIASQRSAHPTLNVESEYQDQGNAGADGARFGAEDFGIGHNAILTYEVGDYRG